MAKDGTAVLDAPERARVSRPTAGAPRRAAGAPALRRDLSEDFALGLGPGGMGQAEQLAARRRFKGVRFRFKGGVPKSIVGRVIAGAVVVAGLAGFTAVLWQARAMLLHDPRLVIASSAAVQIVGNSHMNRPQLLTVFGEDVDRNILTVPLAERRAELEQLPWVEHATVMRLLPNRLRVAIVERTPVAFVRQGSGHEASRIGLVDANGVLLDMAPAAEDGDPGEGAAAARETYSFPVVTGLSADDPLSVRAARMKLYQRFMEEMDSGAEKVSKDVSEVDLSDPEDVKALIPAAGSDILVHFGQDDFLHRYKIFAAHIADWKSANPRLASVDMRYEHQVVLEMARPAAGAAASAGDAEKPAVVKAPTARAGKPVVKASSRAAAKPVAKPVAEGAVPPLAAPVSAKAHLQTAFDVPAKNAAKTTLQSRQAGQP